MRKHKLISLIALQALAVGAMAQEPAKPATVTGSNNLLATMMIIIALVLAFVIWGMGQVLLTMGKQVLDKNRKTEKVLSLLFIAALFIPATSSAQTTQENVQVVANYGGVSATTFWMLATVIGIEFLAIAFMMFGIRRLQVELLPETKAKGSGVAKWWNNMDKKFFTRGVAVEKEADVLLDHDYDGIRELDNSLPPWWKYGFYVTIAVAFVYLMHFHVFATGKNPTEEYQDEMQKAQYAMEAYNAQNKDRVDEENLKPADVAGIAAGKEIFTNVCWTCHGKLGEGGAGPNLTDDYWIHKGSLKDVYLSIKHGYPDKGMQAWEKSYSPKEMQNLASFIKTLKGTNPPNGKLPQGDLFTEEGTATPVSKDSVAVKDSISK